MIFQKLGLLEDWGKQTTRRLFTRVMAMGISGGLALAVCGDGIAVGYRQLGVVDVPGGVLKTEFVTGGDTLEAMAIGTMLMVR